MNRNKFRSLVSEYPVPLFSGAQLRDEFFESNPNEPGAHDIEHPYAPA